MLLIYCGIALLPDAARTQRNMMAVIFLVAATFTVLSLVLFCEKRILRLWCLFSDAGILLIFIISILMTMAALYFAQNICYTIELKRHWKGTILHFLRHTRPFPV